MVIHGSSVRNGKGALVFLGQSGAGKSSIAELLCSNGTFGFIADDLLALCFLDKCWQVVNGEHHLSKSLSGEDIRIHNATPVIGFMLLRQATQVDSERIAQCEFTMRLMNAILEIVGHSTGYNVYKALKWFHQAGHIAKSIPCWRLHFPLSEHTIMHISSLAEAL